MQFVVSGMCLSLLDVFLLGQLKFYKKKAPVSSDQKKNEKSD